MDEAHVESIMTDPTQVSCGKWRATANIRYLRPLSKIILALAACRENQASLARKLLRELIEQNPESELFAGVCQSIEPARAGSPAFHITSRKPPGLPAVGEGAMAFRFVHHLSHS